MVRFPLRRIAFPTKYSHTRGGNEKPPAFDVSPRSLQSTEYAARRIRTESEQDLSKAGTNVEVPALRNINPRLRSRRVHRHHGRKRLRQKHAE